MTATQIEALALTAEQCPAWCTDHIADAGNDWHEGRDVEVHDFVFYATNGTQEHDTRVIFEQYGGRRGMTLEQIEDVASALLELVREVRAA